MTPQPGGTGGIGGGHGKPLTSTGSHGDGNEGEWRQQQGQPWWQTLPQTLAMTPAVVLAAWNGCGLLKAGMVESLAMPIGSIRNGGSIAKDSTMPAFNGPHPFQAAITGMSCVRG